MADNVERYKARRARSLRRRVVLFPYDRFSYRLYFALFGRNLRAGCMSPGHGSERILVVAPHHDDEMLGCGGFLIACRGKADVQPVFVTDGMGPAWLRSEDERTQLAKTRIDEAQAVCHQLGTRTPVMLGFPESDLDGNPELVNRLSEMISAFRPTVIMAPFFTDSHKQHLCVTRSLARVSFEESRQCKVLLYRTHGQIPGKFLNSYYGLSEVVHREKEKLLSIYRSQKLDVDITRAKYLQYSEHLSRRVASECHSVESYSGLDFPGFTELDRQYGDDSYLGKIRGINYAPYSFKQYLFNELIFKLSPFCRKGPELLSNTPVDSV